ncbi:bifunctional [glutamine synthetase] adenylyltransferase/[glutamine synthetase]-adenylyl-L-tyrosine phosphorylase [Pararhizobium haloflavum]|uniref:bifunctional [glutamine synthetase] adenylyltransferase/[glutamine synthetase]-adenylyl-L-tyrosine phosphorylase n=1 Tax=Pararhizobium haloflavum TaxID=2037914 RepID=UPI000C17BBD7|nr:bifunctional [glutamine synthetase] adenylyltransferase/[glutamine synthetase]-adenylyl-L-tyrosine phosphorylase [Pararhizobium haloflavum]
MGKTRVETVKLSAITANPLKPLTKAEEKTARSSLKEMAAASDTLAARLDANETLGAFLVCAFTLSPYLRDTAASDPDALAAILDMDVAAGFDTLAAKARQSWRPDEDEPVSEAELMTRLRRIKRQASLGLALCDLAGIAGPELTTRSLSTVAGATLAAAIDHLLLSLDDAGKVTLKDRADPSSASGLIVLGMGKLGAEELNYSSDIDIVLFFDPDAGILKDEGEGADVFSKMARRLVRIMQERTGDGYVFRTDLRLRPDPGSTPLAIPVEAALNYYEARGQNWERAAFIKVRPVAGDIAAGEAFCRELIPFVFRKYLDYAAISDIHSIKRQIHAHKGFGDIAVKGHNVKLGRGGIREIEFFVQTQQLIAGGRMPALRGRRTDAMLDELAKARWIDKKTAETLTEAYWYLRDVEHRIQMVHDEQSHTLPETEAELKRIALMVGESDTKSFAAAFVKRLKTVERHYAELFEHESHLSDEGNLVFTGEGDDPDTLKTLARLGFERPADIAKIIRTWHYGRYRATQSAEARERLTELTPQLLKTFGQTKRADEALLRFDSFLSGLPSGIQLFSLIGTNPNLLSLIVTIMASAPRLADTIAHKPHVFDGMLDPALLAELPTRDYLADRLGAFLAGDFAYEEILDRLRIVAAEQRFLIGIRFLTGAITGVRAGRALTDLADLILETTLKAVTDEVEAAHGRVPGGRVALVGMGKLGSHEMTAGSDIDMILIYDHDKDADESDGAKPLDPPRYFTRFTQRLIAALSAPTAEGVLYEVDLRLRPSGNKGPVATSITSFEKYQREEAWTWEHMALSRARCVAGEESLVADVERVITKVLATDRDTKKTAADILDMRKLMDEEKPPRDDWDLKLVPGGLVDIEFVAQYLALTVASNDSDRPVHTLDVLQALGPKVLPADQCDTLTRALVLQTELSQMIRLCLDSDFDPEDAPAGLIDQLCRVAEAPDMKTLTSDLGDLQETVRRILLMAVAAEGSKSHKARKRAEG